MGTGYRAPITDLFDGSDIPSWVAPLIGPAEGELSAMLGKIGYRAYSVGHTADGTCITVELFIPGALVFSFPGVDSVALVIGDDTAGETSFFASLLAGDGEYELRFHGVPISFRLPPEVFTPLPESPGAEAPAYAELRTHGTIVLSSLFGVQLDDFRSISLSRSMIARSGLVISADDITPDFSSPFSLSIREAKLELPEWISGLGGIDLILRSCVIGDGGFSGKLELDNAPANQGQLFGCIFQLRKLSIDIEKNAFVDGTVTGGIQFPFFPAPLTLGLELTSGSATSVRVTVSEPGPIAVAVPGVPAAGVSASGLSIDVVVDPSAELAISGGIAALSVNLPGLPAITAQNGSFSFSSKHIGFGLGSLDISGYGSIDQVVLDLVIGDDGAESFALRGRISWSNLLESHPELGAKLASAGLAPPDDASAAISFTWSSGQGSSGQGMAAAISLELPSLNLRFFDALPAAYRPETRNAHLELAISSGGSIDLSAAVELNLGVGRQIGPLRTKLGGEDGWIKTRVRLDATTGALAAQLEFLDPVGLEMALPGISATPGAPAFLEVDLARAGGTLSGSRQGVHVDGRFALNPPLPSAFAAITRHIADLLGARTASELVGAAAIDLYFETGQARLGMAATFDDAALAVDVFSVIERLARGISSDDEASAASASMALEDEIEVRLRGLQLDVGPGSAPPAPGASDAAAAEINFRVSLGVSLFGVAAGGFIQLTDQYVALGLEDTDVPLEMPRFPLTATQLKEVIRAGWSRESERHFNARQRLFLEALGEIRKRVAEPKRPELEQIALELMSLLSTASGLISFHTHAKLHFAQVAIVIPLSDPSSVSASGSASLTGFAADDPLKVLESLAFLPGISATRIFFSVAPTSQQGSILIPLPPSTGRYSGSQLRLGRLSFGYGFTDNSFNVAFDGELDPASALSTDADTSARLGAGIRLPRRTALALELKAIPIPPPSPLPFVPVIDFDLDLRKGLAAPPVIAAECDPSWDGLELIVSGLAHLGLKHLAFAPYFGPLPMPHARFSGDLELGGEGAGVRVIVDEMLMFVGVMTSNGPQPIPFLAEPAHPYFDNLCVRVMLAGLEIGFDLQRPFPTFNPLSLFELAGLIADPQMHVDPRGTLAQMIRVQLSNARIIFPPVLRRWFPGLDEISRTRLDFSLNLGDVISGLQRLIGGVQSILRTISAGPDIRTALGKVILPALDPGSLLTLLPPELRRIDVDGALGGFDARGVIVLLDARKAKGTLEARKSSGKHESRPPQLRWGTAVDPKALASYQPNFGDRSPGDPTPYDPHFHAAQIFDDPIFSKFESNDLSALGAHASGVLIAASVQVFGKDNTFDFIGYLFEDGSFSLATAASAAVSLSLPVGRLATSLAIAARLSLLGHKTQAGYETFVSATFHATWSPLPGIDVAIGSVAPASLQVSSTGTFRVQGDAQIRLYSDLAQLSGAIDIREHSCILDGALALELPAPPGGDPNISLFDLQAQGHAELGPGQNYRISAAGSLNILGHALTEARVSVGDGRAEVDARMLEWVGAGPLNASLDARLHGVLDLRAAAHPSFALAGSGSLAIHNHDHDASVRGGARLEYSDAEGLSFAVEGALSWQGRDWLEGQVSLGRDRFTVSGRTAFAVGLTPVSLGGLSLAGLALHVDLGGSFTLDLSSGLLGYEVRGHWVLGVAGAGAGDGASMFPVAMQKFEERFTSATSFRLQLVDLRSFNFPLPLIQGFDVPFTLGVTSLGSLTFGTKDFRIAGVGLTVPYVHVWIPGAGLNNSLPPDDTDVSWLQPGVPLYDVSFDPTKKTHVDVPAQATIDLGLQVALAWDAATHRLGLEINGQRYDLEGSPL